MYILDTQRLQNVGTGGDRRDGTEAMGREGTVGWRTAIHPAALEFDAEAVAFAGAPLALELAARRPAVNAACLEPALPKARELALPARPCAHPEAVRLALRPPAYVAPAVVEVEPTARPAARGRRWGGCLSGLGRAEAGCTGPGCGLLGALCCGVLSGVVVGGSEVDGVWSAGGRPGRGQDAELSEI